MKLSLIVLGLLVVGGTHWLWTDRLAAQAREDSPVAERHRMVEEQIKARGIKDEGLLAALLKVPRERFVPSGVAPQAHADRPLPIGYGQTISQPYVVAYMTEGLQLTKNKRVLEIGTGSGYQAALLGDLAREVYTIEIVPQLADQARTTLAALGYRNVHVRTGDGYLGWPEQAPFDAIIYGPPRAFLSVSGSYVLLTQHGTPGDSNSAIVLIPTRTFHPVRTPHLGRRGEAWRHPGGQDHPEGRNRAHCRGAPSPRDLR